MTWMMACADGFQCDGQAAPPAGWKSWGLWLLVGDQAAEMTLEITKTHPSAQLTHSIPRASHICSFRTRVAESGLQHMPRARGKR